MLNTEIIDLLTEMKENCLQGDIYSDPKRNDKAEALNYAIFMIKNNDNIEEIFSKLEEELRKCYPSYYSSKPMEESELCMSYRSFYRIINKVKDEYNGIE